MKPDIMKIHYSEVIPGTPFPFFDMKQKKNEKK